MSIILVMITLLINLDMALVAITFHMMKLSLIMILYMFQLVHHLLTLNLLLRQRLVKAEQLLLTWRLVLVNAKLKTKMAVQHRDIDPVMPKVEKMITKCVMFMKNLLLKILDNLVIMLLLMEDLILRKDLNLT